MTHTCEFDFNVGDQVCRLSDPHPISAGTVLLCGWDGSQCVYLVDFGLSRNYWPESQLMSKEDKRKEISGPDEKGQDPK